MPLFFGGLVSALLLRLCHEPFHYSGLSWFALVPLLLSLYRHRHQAAAHLRFVHGIVFGFVLATTSLPWFYHLILPQHSTHAAGVASILTLGSCAAAWITMALFPAAFALAAGPVLRAPRVIWLIGLPALWVASEVLRGPLSVFHAPWVRGWLMLGYALDPGTDPAAQWACAVGVHGLGAAILLANVLLTCCLTTTRKRLQIATAACALVIPVAARHVGEELPPGVNSDGSTIALVSFSDRPGAHTLEMVRAVHEIRPVITVWPGAEVTDLSDGGNLDDLLSRISDTLAVNPAPQVDAQPRQAAEPTLNARALLTASSKLAATYLETTVDADANTSPDDPAASRLEESDTPNVYSCRDGDFALLVGFSTLDPAQTRTKSLAGAEMFVASLTDSRPWSEQALQSLLRMQSMRAVETRRWIALSSWSGAYLTSPDGIDALCIGAGIDGATTVPVAFESAQSLYTTIGWTLEPLSVAFSAAVLVLAWFRRRNHAKTPDDHSTATARAPP